MRNRRQKKELVAQGRAHGVLVYADGEPVGWCQFGPREELPRIDSGRNYRKAGSTVGGRSLWRITCFVVDKEHRQRGVGSAALAAALLAIQREGGGLVEAYPVVRWKPGTFGNVSTHGTVSMFRKQGFKTVTRFGPDSVVMRRDV